MDDETLLVGNFQQYPECSKLYTLQLGRNNLTIKETVDSRTYTKLSDGSVSILLKDVISSRLFSSKIESDKSAYFQVIAYPLMVMKRNRRKRNKTVFTFRVNEAEDEEGNMVIAEIWARSIEWLIESPSITQEDLQGKEAFPRKRRILVLINPKSGNGASVAKFHRIVEPIFIDAGIYYSRYITTSANQATEIAYSLNLSDWDGIAICSGDGLAFEVVQGLMQRDDWEVAVKLPLGMIPTGSGNALCAAVLHHSKDVFDITSAAFAVVRGIPTPIDLCSVENKSRKIFAFLSLTWGIISDIDIESERFRMLGNARFTAGAVSRILTLRIYGGKLSFLPSSSANDNVDDSELLINDERALERNVDLDVVTFHAQCSSSEPLSNEEVDLSSFEEGSLSAPSEGKKPHKHRAFSTTGLNSLKTDKLVNTFKRVSLGSVADGSQFAGRPANVMNVQGLAYQNQKGSGFKRGFSTSDFGNGAVSDGSQVERAYRPNERPVKGPADKKLVSLNQDVPESWTTVEGEFVTVMVLLISHLGSSLYSCPGLELGDGDMWLLFIEKGISRKSLIDILTKMETGDHVSNNDIKIHKIQGFRLEPKFERSGYIAVDGEVIEYDSVQGQIHRGLGRVFACR